MLACLTKAEKTEMVDKVRNIIILCLRDKFLKEFSKKKTSTLMWEKLESFYLIKSLAHKLCLKQQLYSFRMVENKSIVEHLTIFHKIIVDLGNIKVEIKHEDNTILLLSLLSISLELFTSVIYGKECTIILDEVQTVIRSKEF